MRSAVVTLEVALSFVLLVGSGLMIRSFVALQRTEPGYDPKGVLTFERPQPAAAGPGGAPGVHAQHARAARGDARRRRRHGSRRRCRSTAVEALARWGTEEAPADPTKFEQAIVHVVLPGYFDAMRTRVIEGRVFTEADNVPDRARPRRRPHPRGQGVPRPVSRRQDPPRQDQHARSRSATKSSASSITSGTRVLRAKGAKRCFVADGHFGHGVAGRWAIRTSGDPMALAASRARAGDRAQSAHRRDRSAADDCRLSNARRRRRSSRWC